jgi:hypothetical protein
MNWNLQGAGKSHTVSCILESALIKDPRIGSISSQLATLVYVQSETHKAFAKTFRLDLTTMKKAAANHRRLRL